MMEIESYKRNESALVLINMAVIASLFVVHIIFLFQLGKPSNILLITLSIRFIILIFELIWLQKLTLSSSAKIINFYNQFSIWVNIIFAFIASVFGGAPDSHYSVLMIIPIISAAFHFKLWQTLTVAGVTVILTFLEIWIYFQQKPPIDYGEFFEAATVSLIFLVVGLVVWLLIDYLKEKEKKLQQSLAELQQTQAKLVREEKLAAVGQLAGSIAHEIRNPVAMIASSLAMVEKQKSPIKEEMLNIATQEAKRLEFLTSDFLSYARTKQPELKETKISDVLNYVASLVKAKSDERNVQLSVKCSKTLFAKIDSTQIQQALLNLLMNALDETKENGKIILGAESEGDNLKIFVENDGESISDEIVEKIFEPFFTAKPKGTGLGLSIVKNIIQAHQGEIYLANNENGCVSFEILIPVR